MFDHIVSNPAILGGKPCVKGTRISVEFILELAASGASRDDIVKAYPQVTPEDVEQALRYAAESLKNDISVTAEVPRRSAPHSRFRGKKAT
jgi:uncharacterized protein (DUF433 family)